MKNNLRLVKKLSMPEAVELFFAKVVSVDKLDNKYSYVIQLGDGTIRSALKAESCLLVPASNDLTLVSCDINEEHAFILQILTRTSKENTLDFGQDATLCADNIKFEARQMIDIEAPQINLTGVKGTAKFSHSSLLANWSEVRTRKSLFVAESAEKIINTITEKIVNVFKTVDGIEFTKANRIRTLVTGRLFYKAKHLTLNAEEEVGIDGKKINMG